MKHQNVRIKYLIVRLHFYEEYNETDDHAELVNARNNHKDKYWLKANKTTNKIHSIEQILKTRPAL